MVCDDPDRWLDSGFAVDDEGNCDVGGVRLVVEGGAGSVCAWSLDRIEGGGSIDGLATHVGMGQASEEPSAHPNGVVSIDHLVVRSPDVDRTVAALSEAGILPRRERDAGRFRQVFFQLGEVILELVGPHEATEANQQGSGPARFWGIAFTVADFDTTSAYLGDRLGPANDAVQQGRRIASLRKQASLALPLAFMSA